MKRLVLRPGDYRIINGIKYENTDKVVRVVIVVDENETVN